MLSVSKTYSSAPDLVNPAVLRNPKSRDAAKIRELVKACKPLDLNSTYAYLLLCHHFADTCVLAEHQGQIVGFVSGYLPPGREDVIFVWQVAVAPEMRGCGLANAMLRELLSRTSLHTVHYLETTVSPSNEPSRKMFRALARQLETECAETTLFGRALFGGEDHEEEVLLRIGRFATQRQRRT